MTIVVVVVRLCRSWFLHYFSHGRHEHLCLSVPELHRFQLRHHLAPQTERNLQTYHQHHQTYSITNPYNHKPTSSSANPITFSTIPRYSIKSKLGKPLLEILHHYGSLNSFPMSLSSFVLSMPLIRG